MPTRSRSIHGYFAPSCFNAVTWSGKVLSTMLPYQASWNALLRNGVPLVATNTFTQADINAGLLIYTHTSGIPGSDSFDVTVLTAFTAMKLQSDPAIVLYAVIAIGADQVAPSFFDFVKKIRGAPNESTPW